MVNLSTCGLDAAALVGASCGAQVPIAETDCRDTEQQIAALDPDVIVGVWSGMTAEDYELLTAIAPTVAQPDSYDDYGTPWRGAFSHGSPLSIDFALDALVPEIEAAIDGDPSTVVPSAVDVGAVPDVDAASAAWSTVFDPTVSFEEKSALLADAAELEATAEAFTAAGEEFGGIDLEPTNVEVDGDTATITYDVNFGGNSAYEDQAGTITLVDGVWMVSRDEFCSFMSSARVPCA